MRDPPSIWVFFRPGTKKKILLVFCWGETWHHWVTTFCWREVLAKASAPEVITVVSWFFVKARMQLLDEEFVMAFLCMTSDLHASLKEVILLNEFSFRLGNKTWFPLVMSAQNTSADRSWQFQHMFAGLKTKSLFFFTGLEPWGQWDNCSNQRLKHHSFLVNKPSRNNIQVSKQDLKPYEFPYNSRSEQMFHGAFAAVHSILSRNVVSWDKLLKKLFCDFWSLVSNVEGSA